MLRAKCMKARSIRAGSNPARSRGAILELLTELTKKTIWTEVRGMFKGKKIRGEENCFGRRMRSNIG